MAEQSCGFSSGGSWLLSRDGHRFKALLRRANKLDEQGRPEQAVRSRERAEKLVRRAEVHVNQGIFGAFTEKASEVEVRCIYRTQGVEFV